MMRIAAFLLLAGWLTSLSSVAYGQCDSFSIELLPTHPTCESVQNGALTVSVTGATPPINYTWADGASEDTRTGLGTGAYEVTVTDADGCTAVESITLTGLMELDLGGDTTLFCEANNLTLENKITPSTSIFFTLFSNDEGEFIDNNDMIIKAETNNGYVGTGTPPEISFDNPGSLQLFSGSVQANAGDTVCVPIMVSNFDDIVAGIFNVNFPDHYFRYVDIQNVTGLLGSIPDFQTNIDMGVVAFSWVHPTLQGVSLPDSSVLFELCLRVQGEIGNYEYHWNGPDGLTSNTFNIEADKSGLYELTITESGSSGCILEDAINLTFSDTVKIELPDTLYTCADSVTITPDVSCAGDDPSYTWSTGENSESITVLPASPQLYSLTVTSAGGQSSTDSVIVIPSTAPTAEPIDDITLCDPSGLATVSATVSGGTPPYAYAWNGTFAGQTAQISPLGDYVFPCNLIVVDSLECLDTAAFTIFVDSIEASFPLDEVPLCDGTVTLSPDVTGVAGTPAYEWSTGATSSSITVSNPGLYSVTVQSTNDCSVSDGIEVIVDDLSINFSTTQVSCHGGSDGCIDAEATGGVPPYSYQWDTGSTTANLCGLPAGVYFLTVIDANNCVAENDVILSEPAPLEATIVEEQAPSCVNSEDGELSVQVMSGTPPYSYLWSNNLNSASISDLDDGTYTVTITDANGCSVIDQYTLEPQAQALAIADAGPDQTIDCLNPEVTLGGMDSSEGAAYVYEWTGPAGQLSDEITVEVEEPGTYTLVVTDTTAPGCTSSDQAVVAIDTVTPTVELHYTLINCDTARLTYTSDTPVAGLIWYLPDGDFTSADTVFTTLAGSYELTGADADNACFFSETITVPDFPEGCVTLRGQLRHDTLQNCQIEPGEPSLSNWLIAVTGNGQTFYAVTQADGQYEQQVPEGQYELTPILPSDAWQLCQPSYTVIADTPNDTIVQDLQVQSAPCAEFEVAVGLPILRRCWERSIDVEYRNIGAEEVENATLSVLLDEELTFNSANAPLLDQDGQQLTFDIGDVPPNASGSVQLNVTVSCNAAVGEAICIEAKASPSIPCEPPSENWSGASLQVSTDCDEDDEVVFRIENVGDDMTQGQQYIVVEDGVMLLVMPDTVLLEAQESYEFRLPATGATYRLETEQVPFHPEQSTPVAVLEGCGTDEFGSFSTGFVNQFDLGDEDTFIDVECGEIVAAYDPNDKNGYPLGHGPEHNIYPGTELEYRIRFQNTGNDTAFLVVIKDTIDTEVLDLTTVRPGVSSHDYTWDIEDESTLVFTFENILLPDSMTNELGSQGFVDFKIQQQPNLPLGTQIENRAGIYFDINPPIITNTSLHTLNWDFLEAVTHTVSPALRQVELSVIPNPAREHALIQLRHWPANGGWIELFDPLGRPVLRQRFDGQQIELERRNWTSGWYSFRVSTEQGAAMSGRLVWR